MALGRKRIQSAEINNTGHQKLPNQKKRTKKTFRASVYRMRMERKKNETRSIRAIAPNDLP